MNKESDPIRSILTLLLLGCSAASGDDRAAPRIAVELSRAPQSVEVRGLGRTTAHRLERLAPDDAAWHRPVAGYVERSAVDTA